MKTKNKICGIFAVVTAALLVTAALITGCVGPVGGDGKDPLPSGPGSLQLVFDNGPLARTIIPGTTAADFKSFELTFALGSTPGTAQLPPVTTTGGSFTVTGNVVSFVGTVTDLASSPIKLWPGNYTVSVIAYIDNNYTKAAARTAAPVAITVNESPTATTANITLTAYAVAPASGSGTFGWNIDFSSVTGLVSATMAIVPIGGGTNTWSTGSEIDLTGTDLFTSPAPTDTNANTLAAPITLLSGYYDVIFTLANEAITITFQQVLHVYANLPSEYTYTFEDFHFGGTPVTVTFLSWNYTTPANETHATKSVIPGSALGTTNWPAEPTQTGYIFRGWYTDDGHTSGGSDTFDSAWGTEFTYGTTVTASINVYARWMESSGDGALIQVYSSLGPVAQASTMKIQIGGGDVFRIKNEDAFSSYKWIYNGDIISILSEITFGSGGPGIFNTNNTGVRPIVIRAVTNESKWESSYFYVEVQ